jgi:ceramide glucosyltransferase
MLVIRGLAGALVAGGIAYLLLALFHLWRYRPVRHLRDTTNLPAVTIMVPAHGTPPRLEECLRSICDQDYPSVQVVFGLHTPDDTARPVIERVIAAFPNLDATLVINGRRVGTNPKNVNLCNMLPACRHDVLVMVDSDILVKRDFLAGIVQPLAEPGVGGVTCIYTGEPSPGLPARLGALYINDWFVPSVLVDVARQEMAICYGAAIAVTRSALETIGGFESMANAVAQDYVFGHELHRHGYKVRLAPCTVATVVAEPSFRILMLHELRWNRAVRAVRPLDHALSVFMSPLLPAALLLLTTWPMRYALPAIALHVFLRQLLHRTLRVKFRLPPADPWMVPVREMMNVAVWAAAFFGRTIRWNSTVLVTGQGLTMQSPACIKARTVEHTGSQP